MGSPYFNYILITISLVLLGCKSQKTENFIGFTSQPTPNELKKYYKYDFPNFFVYKRNDTVSSNYFKAIIYTNVPESSILKKYPKKIFLSKISIPKDVKYFVENMDGQYVLYLEKEGKVIMREYGNYFDFNKLRDTDSLKWLTTKITTEKQVYDLLKKNNIKYRFISKKCSGNETEIKIQLEPSGYYTYITVNNNFLISTTYYSAKDTIYSYDKLGYRIF